MGKYHKEDIKQMAIDRGYEELAKKPESYEICFIPDNDYRGFLKRRVDGLEERVKGGNFVNTKGEVLGQHDGYPFYTIGQRKLGVSFGLEASYVIEIKPDTNEVVIGSKEDLNKQEMYVKDINFVKYDHIPEEMQSLTKVRYKHQGEMSTLSMDDNEVKVLFHKKVEGIAPGQSAVFYEGNDVVGGGFIAKK
jgi:tRNA-specific 2-thiouridylase